jgi:hypothetical protein
MISTQHITEHTQTAPGLDILVRVFDKGMSLTLSTMPKDATGAQVLVLKGSQIRALRSVLNLAIEEDQS